MSVVTIKLVGSVGGLEQVPELAAHVGRYLTRYEPEKCLTNEQWLWTTNKRKEALTLPFDLAMKLVKTPIGIRADGLLDRPITVFSIELKQVEAEVTT